MADIHRLPTRSRQPDADAEARSLRAQTVRRLIEARPGSLPGARDYADYAGRELFRILKEGGSDFRRRVCEVAFGTRARVPTKRLWGVLVDPEKPRDRVPITAAKRRRLTVYLRLAEAVAAVSGQAEAELILRVFPDVAPDDNLALLPRTAGVAEELRNELWDSWLQANEVIVQDCDLRRSLAVAMEYPRGPAGPFPRFRLDLNQILGRDEAPGGKEAPNRANYALTRSPWDFVFGVAPRRFLGECHCPVFRGVVAPLTHDGAVGETIAELAVWLRVWVRFWWAILPIGPNGDARGCFLASLSTERSPSAIPVGELDADGPDEEHTSEVSWAALLAADGGRSDFHWTNRDLWRARNAAGLVLSWDMAERYSVSTSSFKGPYRCTARLDPGSRRIIRGIFGCDPEALPADPVRILPPSAHWRDVILGLPDGALSDWVGPDPDEPGIREPLPPSLPDNASEEDEQAAEDAYSEALSTWRDEEMDYQLRWLITHRHGPAPARAFARIAEGTGSSPTIGSKLEDSLLDLPEDERPDMALRRMAERLSNYAAEVTGRAAFARRAKLASLGRKTVDRE
ncbi:hypothetical protein [Falsiroseomonas sp. HW251]|uniref:hypothetical protein n=1 Tax=Falsiroseomonas sp. HW251 TaxID=3390998 RepID=UPI003D31E328